MMPPVKQKYFTGGDFLEEILEASLLYDFYGELLTQHQREIYEDFALNDLSLGEISENRGISRQGVHDIVRRVRRQLVGYEEKLHLVERFSAVREQISGIEALAGEILEAGSLENPEEGTLAGLSVRNAARIMKLMESVKEQL